MILIPLGAFQSPRSGKFESN